MTRPNPDFTATLAATGLPLDVDWEADFLTARLRGTQVHVSTNPDRTVWTGQFGDRPIIDEPAGTPGEALAALAASLTDLRADIDAALTAIAPALPPARKARPTCPLCGTDADAPTVERLIFVPATVHAACSAVSDQTPEPGDAADRLPDFVEAHMPDAPDGSLRHREALAALSWDYPGILTINAALKAAQSDK